MIIEIRLCIVNLFCRRRRGSRWATEWASILTGKLINSLTRPDQTRPHQTGPDQTTPFYEGSDLSVSHLMIIRHSYFLFRPCHQCQFCVRGQVHFCQVGLSLLLSPHWPHWPHISSLSQNTTSIMIMIMIMINSGGGLQRCNRNLPRWRTCSVLSGSCWTGWTQWWWWQSW